MSRVRNKDGTYSHSLDRNPGMGKDAKFNKYGRLISDKKGVGNRRERSIDAMDGILKRIFAFIRI